jgi:hypothetical protein
MLQQRPTSAEIPVLQGALFKKKTGLLGSSFQKRWFRIEGDKLMYYKEREDLEHLGVIELSNCKVNRNPGPEETDPFVFVLELPNRRFVLKASKKEHFTIWVETLEKWTNKFRQEREVSSFVPSSSFGRMSSSASLSQQVQHFQEQRNASVPNLPSSSLLHSQDVKDLKESRDGGEDDEDVQFPAPEGGEKHHPPIIVLIVLFSGVPPEVHAQSLLKVQQVLEKVKQQEVLLNTAMQKVFILLFG